MLVLRVDQIAASTATGLRRAVNEDRHAWTADRRVIVLADGLAGRPHGELASGLAIEGVVGAVIREQLTGEGVARLSEAEAIERIRRMFAAAQAAMLAGAVRHGVASSLFSTLMVAMLTSDRLVVGHAGDSRCYRLSRGGLRQLTRDHRRSPHGMAELDDRDQRELQSLVCLPDRGVSGTGDPEPEIIVDQPMSGDTVLLCTNGLSDAVPEQHLGAILADPADPRDLVQRLLAMAGSARAEDDATAVVFRTGTDDR